MSKKKIIALSIISGLLIICTIISISYGFYIISANAQEEIEAATTTPACIGLTITKREAFTMKQDYAVPITDDQFLNSDTSTKDEFKYSFTVTNDCTDSKTLNIGVVPLEGSTLDITKLKYILVDSTQSETISKDNIKTFETAQLKTLPEDMKKYLTQTVGAPSSSLYNIDSVTLNNEESKTYDLYAWVSSEAGNEVMDKSFIAAIVLDSAQ